eukprot:jgi/Botrbrau1/21301/Bobra.0184s0014.2
MEEYHVPEIMRAAQITTFGGPDVLVVRDVPVPFRAQGEVLIKVVATSVNPIDIKSRDGSAFPYLQPKNKTHRFQVGDRVFGLLPTYAPIYKSGTYGEYVSANPRHLVRIPDGISFEEAAAAPLVCLTGFQALDAAHVGSEDRILIQAGSGGVGHVAVQLAHLRGAHVATTCGTQNVDFVKVCICFAA